MQGCMIEHYANQSSGVAAMKSKQSLRYQSGFGNEFLTEAEKNTLPERGNSPQKAARGLYAEQLSGTSFTTPRASNLRSWLYRIRPSAAVGSFSKYAQPHFLTPPFAPVTPDRM